MTTPELNARTDWETRIGLRRPDAGGAGTAPSGQRPPLEQLSPPERLRAEPGRGQVSLHWPPVRGAVGYQVYRAELPDGDYQPLDHRGGDVLAVPDSPYADTSARPGRRYGYRVAALSDVDSPGPMGPEVVASPADSRPGAAGHAAAADADPGRADVGAVTVAVDSGAAGAPLRRPWQPIIGSEHLSHLLSTDHTGGRPIGIELAEALRLARDELGVRSVRAHAILCDDLGVYRERHGHPEYDFRLVDEVYDRLLGLGLRPVVELSFVPRDLASDPSKTVFGYQAIISPPKDWDRWAELIRVFVAHLVDRFGIDEVLHWPFEVWNEANLEVFWSGTPEQFWQLYQVTATAVRSVDARLTVGGPASAAAGWVADQLRCAESAGVALDFVSTHTYGAPPLDLRPLCARHGRPDLALLWTEWGVSPTHNAPVNDSVLSAAFTLRGMYSARDRVDALAYWVVSDHFEELGRPQRLLHGGFGLLSVGNLRKPRYWALYLANQLGQTELPTVLTGDGAGALVQAWASRRDDGSLAVLVWNGTLHQHRLDQVPELARSVTLTVSGLSAPAYQVRHHRLDEQHSNLATAWPPDAGDWPDEAGWQRLREQDTLAEYEPPADVRPADGAVGLTFDLPMPGISLLELTPS